MSSTLVPSEWHQMFQQHDAAFDSARCLALLGEKREARVAELFDDEYFKSAMTKNGINKEDDIIDLAYFESAQISSLFGDVIESKRPKFKRLVYEFIVLVKLFNSVRAGILVEKSFESQETIDACGRLDINIRILAQKLSSPSKRSFDDDDTGDATKRAKIKDMEWKVDQREDWPPIGIPRRYEHHRVYKIPHLDLADYSNTPTKPLFFRKETLRLVNSLNRLRHKEPTKLEHRKCRGVIVEGPPGIGKSCSTWAWVMSLFGSGEINQDEIKIARPAKSVLWIHLEKASVFCVRLTPNSIEKADKIETRSLSDLKLASSFVRSATDEIVVLDGLLGDMNEHRSLAELVESNSNVSFHVQVASFAFNNKSSNNLANFNRGIVQHEMYPWSLEEYKRACDDLDFYDSVSQYLVNRDEELEEGDEDEDDDEEQDKKQDKEHGDGDDDEDDDDDDDEDDDDEDDDDEDDDDEHDDEENDDEEHDDEDEELKDEEKQDTSINLSKKQRDQLIDRKYSLAGVCARWMFSRTFSEIKNEVTKAIESLNSIRSAHDMDVGLKSTDASNHLLVKHSRNTSSPFFMSEYVAIRLASCCTEDVFRVLYQSAKMMNNRSFLGWIFEANVFRKCTNDRKLQLFDVDAQSTEFKCHGIVDFKEITVEKKGKRVKELSFDRGIKCADDLLDKIIRPFKCNNPGFDLTRVEKVGVSNYHLHFFQVTVSKAHKFNLKRFKQHANRFKAHFGIVVDILSIWMVVPTKAKDDNTPIVTENTKMPMWDTQMSRFLEPKNNEPWTSRQRKTNIRVYGFLPHDEFFVV